MDLGAKIFSILRIEKLKIRISFVWEALCMKELKGATPIIEMSIIGCPADSFYKQTEAESETQSLDLESSWFIVLMLSLVLKQ